MSKVAIQGNASGTGTFTIAAPNSNTDRTLTLPDEAGTVLTSASDIPSSSITGLTQGITEADVWRLTTNATVSGGGDITSNLERSDDSTSGLIGSGMSESSGVFTFPSTGIWLINATGRFLSSTDVQYAQIYIEVSANSGSNYDEVSVTTATIDTGGTGYQSASGLALVDVTSISSFRVKFTYLTSASSDIIGNSSRNDTHFSFIRLGDT